MIRRSALQFVAATVLLASQMPAQAPPSTDEMQAAKAKVDALLKQRPAFDAKNEARYRNVRAEWVKAVEDSIDNYLTTALDADHAAPSDVRTALASLGSLDLMGPDLVGPPLGLVTTINGVRYVVAAYLLYRDGVMWDNTSVRVCAYRDVNGRLEVADSTGADLDGYGLFSAEVPAPSSGEVWILTWGNLGGYNGRMIRFRLFAFNGQSFRTIWSPTDMREATIAITPSGFTIHRFDDERYLASPRILPYYLGEDYVLLPDGPHKAASYYTAAPK